MSQSRRPGHWYARNPRDGPPGRRPARPRRRDPGGREAGRPERGRIVLAYGEVTGHAHAIALAGRDARSPTATTATCASRPRSPWSTRSTPRSARARHLPDRHPARVRSGPSRPRRPGAGWSTDARRRACRPPTPATLGDRLRRYGDALAAAADSTEPADRPRAEAADPAPRTGPPAGRAAGSCGSRRRPPGVLAASASAHARSWVREHVHAGRGRYRREPATGTRSPSRFGLRPVVDGAGSPSAPRGHPRSIAPG